MWEDYERAHLLEYYYLQEQEWQEYEYWCTRKVIKVSRGRKTNINHEWAFRAKQQCTEKTRGRKVKH